MQKNKIIEAKQEIDEFKQTLESPESIKTDGFKLFSELLKKMREQKDIKTLTICRQVKSLEIIADKVSLVAEQSIIEQISKTEEIYVALKDFFKLHGLGINIEKKFVKATILEVLTEWLGEKLIIK